MIPQLELIEMWAKERELNTADPKLQMLKLIEEVGELASGLVRGNDVLIKDSIGDIVVVLQVLCLQLDISLLDCLNHSWEEIKFRKGKMVDGIFVKEEDLYEE